MRNCFNNSPHTHILKNLNQKFLNSLNSFWGGDFTTPTSILLIRQNKLYEQPLRACCVFRFFVFAFALTYKLNRCFFNIEFLSVSLDLKSNDDCYQSSFNRAFVEFSVCPSIRNLLKVRGCYDCLPFTLSSCSPMPATYGQTTADGFRCGVTVVIPQVRL